METKKKQVDNSLITKEKTLYLVTGTKSQSSSVKESSSEFICPSGTVMTGRYHKGDENGTTCYEYATLKAIDSEGNVTECTISIENITWSSAIKESSDYDFRAPKDKVIVGRRHKGDENGYTYYAYADVKVNGKDTTLIDGIISKKEKESSIG